ncbi:MAG: tetratricopeptide repeat protein [Eubacteriales bacterium]|nr:tetratricopeptide repeat protein [Eubacteriales bacterium]
MEEMLQEIERMFQEGRQDEVEPYLIRALQRADEEKQYEAYAAIANQMVGFYQMTGQYNKAAEASEDLLLLLEELQQEDSEYFTMVLLNYANGYRDNGQMKEAEENYHRCELILNRIAGGDLAYAALYSNQGLFCLRAERYQEAEAAFRMSNERFAAAGQEQDPHFVSNIAGIGEALYRQGDCEGALASYEKALELIRDNEGEGESYALLCRNCAAIAESMHDAVTAQSYRDKAERILA